MTIKHECSSCGATVYPEIEAPTHSGPGTTSRVSCPNCGHRFGTLEWSV